MSTPTAPRPPRHAAQASVREPSPAGGPEGPTPDRSLGGVLLAGGLVGVIAAVVLLMEKIALAGDPNYVPSCSIDPVLSCGSIMRTAQAAAFGFPNPVMGVASFPVVAAAGALVLSGVRLPRWFWLALQFGVTVGLAFVAWLIVQSLAVIGALCPYCMVVWTVTIAIAWFTTAYNLAAGHVDFGAPGRALARRRGSVLVVLYLVVVVAVIATFPDYWAGVVGL